VLALLVAAPGFSTALCCPQVSLYDVTPSFCVGDLTKLLEEFARR
jgi:hypothetical protein